MTISIHPYITLLIIYFTFLQIKCQKPCPSKAPSSPKTITTSSYTRTVTKDSITYTPIKIGKVLILKEPVTINSITSNGFSNSLCPDERFIIPVQSDFELILNTLGDDAYNFMVNTLELKSNIYYICNTKGPSTQGSFYYMSLYLSDNNIVNDEHDCSQFNCQILCIFNFTVTGSFNNGYDFIVNEAADISFESYAIKGGLWRYDGNNNNIKNELSGSVTFSKSGFNYIELWYIDANDNENYKCWDVYVDKEIISQSQTYTSINDIKVTTSSSYIPYYNAQLHFTYSNVPVAPRRDGGYYIFYTTSGTFNLKVNSYDKDDNILKEFDTGLIGYPYDIVATDYGFALYIEDKTSSDYSYIVLYKKDFTLFNKVTIMNNNQENKLTDATSETQLIFGDENGSLLFGMRFMYNPDGSKLFYGRGRIFLIFSHYNYFLDNGGHTGDTSITFNDKLKDVDLAINWGCSHSLIQSVTSDRQYFWTVTLGDAYPEGLYFSYISKKDFTSNYDKINKKYRRKNTATSTLVSSIKGVGTGISYGKLGGIMYFKKYEMYAVVFSDTNDDTSNRHGLYYATWKLNDGEISNNVTKTIVQLDTSIDVNQVRAGRYGEDYIIILYSKNESTSSRYPGNLIKGSQPIIYVLNISSGNIIENGGSKSGIYMPTNEDMRTFDDGVLIWSGIGENGQIYIHKIGTHRLSSSSDDVNIDLDDLVLKEEVINDNDEENEENEENEEGNNDDDDDNENDDNKKKKLSNGAIAGIVIGCIIGCGLIGFGVIYILHKKNIINWFNKNKNNVPNDNINSSRDLNTISKAQDDAVSNAPIKNLTRIDIQSRIIQNK